LILVVVPVLINYWSISRTDGNLAYGWWYWTAGQCILRLPSG